MRFEQEISYMVSEDKRKRRTQNGKKAEISTLQSLRVFGADTIGYNNQIVGTTVWKLPLSKATYRC